MCKCQPARFRQVLIANVTTKVSGRVSVPLDRVLTAPPTVAARTRIVSVAGTRLDPGNLCDLSKGYFATTFLSSSPPTPARQSGLNQLTQPGSPVSTS